MANKGRVLYVGVTGFLFQRVMQHKAGEVEGFTKHYVNRLVYYESFQYVDRAIERESDIKRWRREKKIVLIHGSELNNLANCHLQSGSESVKLALLRRRLQPQFLHHHLQILPRLFLLARIAQEEGGMIGHRQLGASEVVPAAA
jgi:putative endonuclease